MEQTFFRFNSQRMIVMTLSFVICLFSFSPVKAQVDFGVKGGYELTNMEFSAEVANRSNRSGFFVGPTLKISLPVTGVAVDVSGLYSKRDLKVESESFCQQSILLQGDARFSAGIGDALNIFIYLGPQFSFNVGDDILQWLTDNKELKQFTLQETMLSVNMGAGVTFAKHFEGRINYNVPISKTGDFTWSNTAGQMWDNVWHHSKTRTNAWSAAITYYF